MKPWHGAKIISTYFIEEKWFQMFRELTYKKQKRQKRYILSDTKVVWKLLKWHWISKEYENISSYLFSDALYREGSFCDFLAFLKMNPLLKRDIP